MEIKILKIADLNPAEYNPRRMTEKEAADLTESIKKFGFAEPIVVNGHKTRKNVIVGGHQRVEIAKTLGITTIPCVFVDLPIELEQELNLRLNKNTGSWDYEWLANINAELLAVVGFTSEDMDKIFNLEDSPDADDIPEVPKVADSKPGEIYELGPHRLMCGDATNSEDVRRLMAGKRAEMVFTDPPYNVDYTGSMNAKNQNKREAILNDKMGSGEFYKFLHDALQNMMLVTDGAFYVCMSSSELATLKTAFEAVGGHWQSFIIWVKNTFTLSRADYQNRYEPIMNGWNPKGRNNHYFTGKRNESTVWDELKATEVEYKDGKTYIKTSELQIEIDGRPAVKILKEKNRTDIWEVKKPARSPDHPTMKPVALCTRAIKNSSLRDQIVLDLFGGSGSTLIAAEQAGRACYIMELDPKYCDVIRKRYEIFTGNTK